MNKILNKIKSKIKVFKFKKKKQKKYNNKIDETCSSNIKNELCNNSEIFSNETNDHINERIELPKEEKEDLIINYGKCDRCYQPNSEGNWCKYCYTKLFLEESRTIECYREINELSKDERNQFKRYGICPNCKQMNTGKAWCNKCDPGRFLKSGDSEIDKLIYEAQLETDHYCYNLEYIPFNQFKDIKFIGEGGFSKIYTAIWLDGIPKIYRIKSRTKFSLVVLKKINGSKFQIDVFINEIKLHYKCRNFAYSDITQLYGITKDPETSEYIMVLEYAEYGSLRNYLASTESNKGWIMKLKTLLSISQNLTRIHELDYIHRDLHSGNILRIKGILKSEAITKITDLGLSQSIYNLSSDICGILPYMAPEILSGKPYTFASDIYSLGIIMVELTIAEPPYRVVPHDETLALAICNGLRPRVAKGTPKCYIDLANRCLDADPQNRPSAKEFWEIIAKFHYQFKQAIYNKGPTEIGKEFVDAILNTYPQESCNDSSHSDAIYTSRYFSFSNLPKPRNSVGVQILNPEVSDPDLIKQHIYNYLLEFGEDFS